MEIYYNSQLMVTHQLIVSLFAHNLRFKDLHVWSLVYRKLPCISKHT